MGWKVERARNKGRGVRGKRRDFREEWRGETERKRAEPGLVSGWLFGIPLTTRSLPGVLSQKFIHSFVHSFIHSFNFYNASSSPLPLKGAPDTARTLCWNFMPKRHRQLWVKDLPKSPTWRLERESNPWPFDERRRLNQSVTTPHNNFSNLKQHYSAALELVALLINSTTKRRYINVCNEWMNRRTRNEPRWSISMSRANKKPKFTVMVTAISWRMKPLRDGDSANTHSSWNSCCRETTSDIETSEALPTNDTIDGRRFVAEISLLTGDNGGNNRN